MSPRRVVSRRTIELTWKCNSCSHVNKGRDVRCVNCGSPKEKEEGDIMPADTKSVASVTDPDLLKKAKAGPNWVCPYCGSQTRNLEGNCLSCAGVKDPDSGHPEDHGPRQYHPDKPYYPDAQIPRVERGGAPASRHDDDNDYTSMYTRMRRRRIIIASSFIGGAVLLIVFLLWLFMPREVNAVVSTTDWKHTVELQQRFLRHGTGWKSDAPHDAFNMSCVTRQRGTEDCNPYDCNPHDEPYDCNPYDCNCSESCTESGNGFASCTTTCSTCYDTCYKTVYDTCYEQCPVYEDWCSYDYHVWETQDTQTAGGSDHEEYWPEFDLQGRSDLREIRHATYLVQFASSEDEKTWDYDPDSLDEFRRFVKGEEWLIKVNRAGMVWPQHLIK